MRANPYLPPAAEDLCPRAARESRHVVAAFCVTFSLFVAAWTVIAISTAANNKGWEAVAIAFCIGPGVNLFLSAMGALFFSLRRARKCNDPLMPAILTIVVSTVASIVAVAAAVLAMELDLSLYFC